MLGFLARGAAIFGVVLLGLYYAAHPPLFAAAPAAMTGDLVEIARTSNCDLSSLATVGGGGAPRAPDQVKNIELVFDNALPNTGWGMTETNAIGTGIGGEDYLAHPGSSGRCSINFSWCATALS